MSTAVAFHLRDASLSIRFARSLSIRFLYFYLPTMLNKLLISI